MVRDVCETSSRELQGDAVARCSVIACEDIVLARLV